MTKIELGEHVVTYKGLLAILLPVSLAQVGMDWNQANNTEAKIETRVSQTEFDRHVSNQLRWQDRIESRLDAIAKAAVNETNDINQAQYVLVKLPDGDAELKDQRIRDMLIQRGKLSE